MSFNSPDNHSLVVIQPYFSIYSCSASWAFEYSIDDFKASTCLNKGSLFALITKKRHGLIAKSFLKYSNS